MPSRISETHTVRLSKEVVVEIEKMMGEGDTFSGMVNGILKNSAKQKIPVEYREFEEACRMQRKDIGKMLEMATAMVWRL